MSERAASQATDPLQEHVEALERVARLTVGDDDERFVLVFQSLVNLLDGFLARQGEEQRLYARSLLMRSAEPHVTRAMPGRRAAIGLAPGPPADSVLADPVFLENSKRLITDRQRIVGGIETTSFGDCVAVGSADAWCCTGTLVAPNVVVTAGHCRKGGCSARVFFGTDVTKPDEGRVVEVAQAVAHPDYRPPAPTHDLSVLILAADADAEPRAIASGKQIEAAGTVRLAGYGNTDVFSSGGYGTRRMVDVPLASADPKYGANPETEFVAGAPFLDRDSCNGDSGGPAYVKADGNWFLAGATSRATASTFRPCGDGGIYTRVGAFEEWIRSVPGGHWS
jgi:secreted trypsin-like serine protease